VDFKQQIEKMPLTLTLCSGKGGVGKSVLSANLAYLLSQMGYSVLLWDADSYFPNQHLLFGVEPPVRLSQVFSGNVKITDAIFIVNLNLHLLADSPATGIYNYPSNISMLDIYQELLLDTKYDIIIFDSPAGASEKVIQCAKLSDYSMIMITDEPTSLLDGYGLMKILMNFVEIKSFKLLINNVIDFEDADEINHKINSATRKFLDFEVEEIGFVPYDRIVRLSIQRQELFSKISPESEIIASLKKIAIRISELITN
jgi:flagellar biosynthesis protein FlhG